MYEVELSVVNAGRFACSELGIGIEYAAFRTSPPPLQVLKPSQSMRKAFAVR